MYASQNDKLFNIHQHSRQPPYRRKLRICFSKIRRQFKISMYQIQVCFCLNGMFVPVTCSFHQFRIRRHLKFELFINPESTCWTVYRCFIFISIQTPQLRPLTMSSLKYTRFQNTMCAETTLGEFATSLILVISCEPVNVETESRNFFTFEAQHVYRCQ